MAIHNKFSDVGLKMAACKEHGALDTRDFLGRISDKWSILIVVVLASHPNKKARFSEIKKSIEGISQTMLTATLRSLERDGIVSREVFPEVPPKVEYELTSFGLGLLKPMNMLLEWVSENWGEVKKARKRYDSSHNTFRQKNS